MRFQLNYTKYIVIIIVNYMNNTSAYTFTGASNFNCTVFEYS